MPTLDFRGKQVVYDHHRTVPLRPLVPRPDKSLGPMGGDDNLVIHGDNLHALKSLMPDYEGRIKCVYIDPPYNTGNNSWVYNDNVNSPLLQDWLQSHHGIDGKDLERHDKWLCMMWPRLNLLRELLSDSGVIFVSIDAIEHHHLRMLMDEIFGEGNFIADIAVVSNLSGSSDQFGIAGAHEYCLAYARDRSRVVLGRFPVDEETLAGWQRDEKGYYKPELLRRGALTYSESLDYPIFVDPDGRLEVADDDRQPSIGGPYTAVYPAMNNGNGIWRWSKRRIHENPSDVFSERKKDGSIAVLFETAAALGPPSNGETQINFLQVGIQQPSGRDHSFGNSARGWQGISVPEGGGPRKGPPSHRGSGPGGHRSGLFRRLGHNRPGRTVPERSGRGQSQVHSCGVRGLRRYHHRRTGSPSHQRRARRPRQVLAGGPRRFVRLLHAGGTIGASPRHPRIRSEGGRGTILAAITAP